MSDDTPIIVLDLYRALEDPDQLAVLHKIQRDRLDEEALTGGKRPPGMRLSCPDPIRRVKGAFGPWWLTNLDDGLQRRGAICEYLLEVVLFHSDYAPLAGKQYASQVPCQWHEHGRTAFDWIAANVEASDRIISCKSKDPKGKHIATCKPSSANQNQDTSMAVLAGYPASTTYETWMVDPGTLRASGPHLYTVTDDDVARVQQEAAAVAAAYTYFDAIKRKVDDVTKHPEWNDPDAWLELFGLTSTSGAFRYPQIDAGNPVEIRVRAERRAAKKLAEAKAEYETASTILFEHVDEQLNLARKIDPMAKSIRAYAGDDDVIYGRKSNGAKQITVKPRPPAEGVREPATIAAI